MQLTNVRKQGDLKQTFKTRETAFRVIEPNGREASLTNKCADAAKIFRQTLGVSKAVLENVIFCHQDEALWPFSDQANLKKIFDEIFETAKLSKKMDELKKL